MTQSKPRNYVAIAARYAGDVVSGKILACQWTIKAARAQIAGEAAFMSVIEAELSRMG